MDTKPSTENPVNVGNLNPIKQTFADNDLDKEYIDNRKVTISLVHNYSNYRKVNMKVLGQRKEVIGSSITSCRILSSNQSEIEKYFPPIVGLSPNNPEFVTRVKTYLSNITCVINENDKELNISFKYNTKRDYLAFKKKEEAIEEAFSKIDRANTSLIKEALKRKIEDLNALESEKHKVGTPLNVEEYILYRHCLLYRDVAKDTALINSDATLRFYIKDEAREAEKQRKHTLERKTAMRNFVELGASDSKFNALYVAMSVLRNENVATALLRTHEEKEAAIMDFANTQPDKFNRLFKDSNLITKAFIETLIVRGELVRSEFNQQIHTATGDYIGANMNEAVAYFNNPEHKDLRSAFENKLKMF